MKSRIFALGILLLGIAACLWVALSWFRFIETSNERQEEKIHKEVEKIHDDYALKDCAKFQGENYRSCMHSYGIEAQ